MKTHANYRVNYMYIVFQLEADMKQMQCSAVNLDDNVYAFTHWHHQGQQKTRLENQNIRSYCNSMLPRQRDANETKPNNSAGASNAEQCLGQGISFSEESDGHDWNTEQK